MNIIDFVEKDFELLKTIQGWRLIIYGGILGLMLYHTLHESELREVQLKNDRLEAIARQQNLARAELTILQKNFLFSLIKYQDRNDLKEIIVLTSGEIFDDTQKKSLGVNVIQNFLEKDPALFLPNELPTLILSIPEKYLKIIPESRFDSPYVLTYMPMAKELLKKE